MTTGETWTSDRYIWKMLDGTFQAQADEFPRPAMAVELVARKGESIPRAIAARHGWISRDKGLTMNENIESLPVTLCQENGEVLLQENGEALLSVEIDEERDR